MHETTFESMRNPVRAGLTAALFAMLAACAPATRSDELPAGEASFAGRIEARESTSMLLVATSMQPAGADKASVRWHAGTRIVHASGATASAADLQVGRHVRAWFDGPVAESYPVQASAGTIVVDAP